MKYKKTSLGKVPKIKHNGTTNYATWYVLAYLDNTEGAYYAKLDRIKRAPRIDAFLAQQIVLSYFPREELPDNGAPGERFIDIDYDAVAADFREDYKEHF